MTGKQRSKKRRRRGLAIIPALLCVTIVFLVCGVLVKQSGLLRRTAVDRENQAQSTWLAESGLSRAIAKLEADRAYKGETWEITAVELGQAYPGVVKIDVKPVDDASKNQVKVHVQADYPRVDAVGRRRSSATMIFDLGPVKPGGSS